MYELTIEGRPKPKQRPRVTKNSTYNPSQKDEQKILALWQQKYGRVELESDLEMIYQFFVPDRRHGDIKNLIALVEDALGGKQEDGYRPFNDKQVKKLHGYIGFDKENPRTEVVVKEIS